MSTSPEHPATHLASSAQGRVATRAFGLDPEVSR